MMNPFLVEMLGVNAPDWDYLDESAKWLFLNSGFALLSSFCQSSLDTEERIRTVENLQSRVGKIESSANYVNKFGPSKERHACMALPLEKWKEVLFFYLHCRSANLEALSFLREMTFQCEDGWPTQPTLFQSQWALSLIDSYDTWYERRVKSEKVSFIKQIVKKWKRYTKPVKSKKSKTSAKKE